jgi:dinuclear metal center YbgI/SA1388 family protein
MSVHAQTIIAWIEQLAPKAWAEDWDNVGLLVGSLQKQVERVLLTLDVDEAVVEEAIALGSSLIIAHHPLIFRPLKAIRTDLANGKLLERLIKHDIAVYAAHTNLDVSPTGVNQALAEQLGLSELEPLKTVGSEQLYKLVVYVPLTHAAAVRQALGDHGAGHLGNYSHCSFSSPGSGRFLPLSGSNPYLGKVGKLEIADEERVEVVVSTARLRSVVRAMLRAHPYEEVAYDIIALENPGPARSLGYIGSLPQALSVEQFLQLIKAKLQLKGLRFAGQPRGTISKVAVCGGSGGDLVYAASGRADALVTGDVGYHQAQDAAAQGLLVVDAGHYATEWPVLTVLQQLLRQNARPDELEVLVSTANHDVWNWA